MGLKLTIVDVNLEKKNTLLFQTSWPRMPAHFLEMLGVPS